MTQEVTPSAPSEPRLNPWTTITRWLLVINTLIFVLDWFVIRKAIEIEPGRVMPVLESIGYFSFSRAVGHFEFWRFFTYQFCHANIDHILLNMLSLAVIGPLVEETLGRSRFLLFYLICGAAGPIAHLFFGQIGLMNVDAYTPLVGASASIYGVLVAAARIAPNDIMMLAFPPIDVKLKTFVIAMISLSLTAVAFRTGNAGGHAAHIGGAVMGWFLIRQMLQRQ